MVIFKNIIHKFLDFVFPPQCLICREFVMGGGICSVCMVEMNFISNPMCKYCGRPFEFAISDDKHSICVMCLRNKPKVDRCISSVRYNDMSKKIILPFKHIDKVNFAEIISKIMFRSGSAIINKADFIIPVPLHFKRLIKRRYNQSSLIASRIGKFSGKSVLYNVLVRNKFSESQGHLSLKARLINVKDNFRVRNFDKIIGKSVILIDDVYTTGATLNECAKVLKDAGARRVYALTFARVVR